MLAVVPINEGDVDSSTDRPSTTIRGETIWPLSLDRLDRAGHAGTLDQLARQARELEFDGVLELLGSRTPEEVRGLMEAASWSPA